MDSRGQKRRYKKHYDARQGKRRTKYTRRQQVLLQRYLLVGAVVLLLLLIILAAVRIFVFRQEDEEVYIELDDKEISAASLR